MGRWDWVEGCGTSRKEPVEGVVSASYGLNRLVEDGLISSRRAAGFYRSGLADFSWRVFWSKEGGGRWSRERGMRGAQGFVVFLHGWDGNHAIWEQIPAMVCAANPRLVALAPDVNGFGGSPFADEYPDLTACDPAANMAAVEQWIDLLGLRSGQQATQRTRVITLVGHSMSGAALFYLDESRWRLHEVARLAVAPALLTNDTMRKGFYKALGVGIWAGSTANALEWLKVRLAPTIVEALIGDASRAVKEEHVRMFTGTPRGTLAQTFYAMGTVPHPVEPRRWENLHVVLGHKDRLVGVKPMLDLLGDLGLTSDQVRVVLGDHYLFSASNQSRRWHLRNREIVVETALQLHDACRATMRG